MSAFLKMFVIKVVSLPKYVKGAHLCVVLPGFWLGVIVACLRVGGMCVCIGNTLFSMMSWMVSILLYIRHVTGGRCSAC